MSSIGGGKMDNIARSMGTEIKAILIDFDLADVMRSR